MQRLFKPVSNPTMEECQKACERSSMWKTLQAWLPKCTRFNFSDMGEDPTNIRLLEFQLICKMPAKDAAGHYENLLYSLRHFMILEKKETDLGVKTTLWKQIAEKLEEIEDWTSSSMLQKRLKKADPNVDEQLRLFKDPSLTFCLSPRRFSDLIDVYPDLAKAMVNEEHEYHFLTESTKKELTSSLKAIKV